MPSTSIPGLQTKSTESTCTSIHSAIHCSPCALRGHIFCFVFKKKGKKKPKQPTAKIQPSTCYITQQLAAVVSLFSTTEQWTMPKVVVTALILTSSPSLNEAVQSTSGVGVATEAANVTKCNYNSW